MKGFYLLQTIEYDEKMLTFSPLPSSLISEETEVLIVN